MAMIGFKDVSISFGGHPLLDHVNLQMERGERICLLGRNGAGKSTLLQLIHGDILPDDGEIVRQQGVRIAMLPRRRHGAWLVQRLMLSPADLGRTRHCLFLKM